MSGDVQPRKRKDKKRKKEELGVEEPRGTAAALGEGDVFIHSHHDHGTGGHWCAKIIFFSLLAVLVTLIGLIILENRGLSDLEANSVESRYSGVLEGWLEDAPDDDHHDEHTLELNHPDDDEDDHGHDDDSEELEDDHDDEDENDDEHDEEEDELNQSDDGDDQESNEQQDATDSQEDNDEVENFDHDDQEDDHHRKYYDDEETENDGDDDEQQENESEETNEHSQADGSNEEGNDSTENDIDDENELNDESEEGAYNEEENAADNEDEEEHDEEDEEDTEVEIEKIEKEIDLEPISTELPALPEDDDDDNDKSEELSTDAEDQEKDDEDDGVAPEDLDDDFLEDDSDEPPIERITAPVGKPFVEVEEEDSSEKPPDTLAEEEEYEKQQEERKREEEKSSHMWVKLAVGGALLAATHALVRRATAPAPRDATPEEERSGREETPLIDRRMTLVPEEPIPVPRISAQSYAPPVPREEIVQRAPVTTQQTSPPQEEEYEEDDEEKETEDEEIEVVPSAQDTEDKELYSEEEVEEEEDIEVKKEVPKLSAPKPKEKVVEPEKEPEDEEPDDVEIIDDEQLEEEDEEEDDEEEISDVDDAELLSRLEAKYGRLPEPERPGQKPKDGGNSVEDEWPGEPSDAFWRQELDSAEDDLRRGSWGAAEALAADGALRGSARARWLRARAADRRAEAERDNAQLGRAIAAYLHLLKMHDSLSDDKLKLVTERALDRIMFRGSYLSAEPVYRLLIRRFPEEVGYRNNLTISFLMANRADLAEEILKETIKKWPNDRVALAHYGFVLKTLRNRLEEAVEAFQKALEGDTGPANEPRFYYHLGDALLLLGRPAEAHEVHKRGAKLGHFLSPAQRSLYNVPRLKGQPWWNIDETPYTKLARALEQNWKEILKEGEAAKSLYEKEREGLQERGDWSQLDLFARGQEIPNRCKNAPVTCSIVRSEPAAVGCRRGQIKFSAMAPGTHVRAHVGPTNCRLRMHLALSNTKNTFLRVDQTVRQWQVGKVLMFDDSFEHEVWHNGSAARLVLIVDVWHPELTPRERRALPAI